MTTSLDTVQDAPAVRAANATLATATAAARAAGARASTLRAILEPQRFTGAPAAIDLVDQFEAKAQLPSAELDEAHALAAEQRARAQRDAVLAAERDRYRQARAPGRVAAIERLLTAAEAAQRAAREVADYEATTAQALGVLPPPPPLPPVLALAEPIARVRRTLASPPPALREPMIRFAGRTWIRSSGLRTASGERVPVSALEASEVEQVLREGWAQRVEVGG